MPKPFRTCKCFTHDGQATYWHPRIRPAAAPLGVPAYFRAHQPDMFRLLRQVQALERHNLRVIDMRLTAESRRRSARWDEYGIMIPPPPSPRNWNGPTS